MVFTRADPFLGASGDLGSHLDEHAFKMTLDTATPSARALIEWVAGTTVWPDAIGAWRFTGGNQGGDCALLTDEATYSMASTVGWVTGVFRWPSWPSNAGKYQIMIYVTDGDGASRASLKPCIKIDQAGNLYLGDSNGTTNDVLLYAASLNTTYFINLSPRGGAGTLNHRAVIYDSTGVELASVNGSWAVGNAGSNDVCKWGNTGGGNTTGMVMWMRDLLVFKGVEDNPGPCRVWDRIPTGVVAAGNFTAVGAADIAAATNGNKGGCRTITDLATTASSTTITSATANFTADDIGAIVANVAGIAVTNTIASVTNSTTALLTNSTGVLTATGQTASIQRRGHDGDVSYANVSSGTASSAEFDLTTIAIPDGTEIHTVRGYAVELHTGSAPTVNLGVKSGATTENLTVFPNSSTSFNSRRAAVTNVVGAVGHSLDPATAAQWAIAAAEGFTGIFRDGDALVREFRATLLHWQVVGALVPAGGATVEGSAALAGTGALTATGVRTVEGAATASGTGALAAAGTRTVEGQAATTGTGDLSAEGVRTVEGEGALAGTGTLTATGDGVATVEGTATLAGAGALTATGVRTVEGEAALAGAGALTASADAPTIAAHRAAGVPADTRARGVR